MALRVPVSNGSIYEMVLTLKKNVTKEDINKALKEASESELKGIMSYTEESLLSTDIIGEPHSSIVYGLSTTVLKNKSNMVKGSYWYGNEWSFACRLVDLIKFMIGKLHHPR